MKKIKKHQWFSILMALGIIAILMIVVTGLAAIYSREFKLSRLSYDEIIANISAEWAFEYAMLKVKNHEDWFQDEMTSNDIDWKKFLLNSERNKNLTVKYEIKANANDLTEKLSKWKMLVIPLFVDEWEILENNSKKPEEKTSKIKITRWLKISTKNDSDLIWSISATNENNNDEILAKLSENYLNQNIILHWKWSDLSWKIQLNAEDCYEIEWDNVVSKKCDQIKDINEKIKNNKAEKIFYTFESDDIRIEDFLKENREIEIKNKKWDWTENIEKFKISNPYLILYNNWNTDLEIEIKSEEETPFALPKRQIQATAQKWDASQIFSFNEDKNQYYQEMLNTYTIPETN